MKETNTLHGKMKMRRMRVWKRILIAVVILLLICVGALLVLRYVTYEHVNVVKVYESESSANGNYKLYANGVLEYSKDGVALLKKNGDEIWNQPCQMSNPFIEICQDTVVVADKGGTSILVFQKDGLKGEIHTTNPIEKVSVSSQGIVAAILKDENVPRVMCYDAKGNLLVEHKATFSSTGYPVDVDLSQDGNVLAVSYLGVNGSAMEASVAYFNFGEAGESKEEHRVAEFHYENTVVPIVEFLNKNISLIVTDHSLVLVKGLEEPEKIYEVTLDKEIRSVAYNEKMIAIVLKNAGNAGYELRTYNLDGQPIYQTEFEGEYANLKLVDNKVFLFDGSKCAIYNSIGICKYSGNIEMQILDIFPATGYEKYNVISANGFQEIQLAK